MSEILYYCNANVLVMDSICLMFFRFLLGPPDVKEEDNFGKIPHVILHAGPTPEELQLVVYKLQNACICIFIDGTFRPGLDYFP